MIPAMKRTAAALLAVLALVSVAGCGGSKAAAPATGHETTFASSPTPSGPSVAQVASLIAQLKAAITKAQPELKDCPAVDDPMGTLSCSLGVDLAQIDAETAITKMQALGAVPTEVSDLFAATLKRYQQMAKLNAPACDKSADSKACQTASLQANFEVSDLLEQLAGWSPYL